MDLEERSSPNAMVVTTKRLDTASIYIKTPVRFGG